MVTGQDISCAHTITIACGCEYITIRKARLYKAVAIHFYSDSDTDVDVMIAGHTVACTHVHVSGFCNCITDIRIHHSG